MSLVYLFSIASLSGLVFVISTFCSLRVYFVLFLVSDVGDNVTDLRLFSFSGVGVSCPVTCSALISSLFECCVDRGGQWRAAWVSLWEGLQQFAGFGGSVKASQDSTRVPCTSCQPPQPPRGAGGRHAPGTHGETNQPSNQLHGLNKYIPRPKGKVKLPFSSYICPGI